MQTTHKKSLNGWAIVKREWVNKVYRTDNRFGNQTGMVNRKMVEYVATKGDNKQSAKTYSGIKRKIRFIERIRGE